MPTGSLCFATYRADLLPYSDMLLQTNGPCTPGLRPVPGHRFAASSTHSGRRHSNTTLPQGVDLSRVDSDDTLVEPIKMTATTAKATIERRRSHGIGGAGNMRKLFVEAIALLVAGLTTSLRSAVGEQEGSGRTRWCRR